jgi:TPR repeat protein
MIKPVPSSAVMGHRSFRHLDQCFLGRLIYLGTPTRDLNEASSWLKKSKNQGDPFASYLLGKVSLERGDYARAASLFRGAALQGLPQAQKHLATVLRSGQGVQVDKSEAYAWMLVSRNSGLYASAEELHALESDLGSSELERAKGKAREIEAKTARAVTGHGCTGWPGEFDEVPSPPPPDLQRFCR